MANKRITDVDFIDSLQSDESFFVNQNNTLKQINKGNVVFEIVNGGTGANNAEEALTKLGAASQTDLENVQTELQTDLDTLSENLSTVSSNLDNVSTVANNAKTTANAAMPKANFKFTASTGTLDITL